MSYLIQVRYSCGHYRIKTLKSSQLAAVASRYRSIPCLRCRIVAEQKRT